MMRQNGTKNDKDCTLQCAKAGGSFVVVAPETKTVYQLDDQQKPAGFAGQPVRVSANYGIGANTDNRDCEGGKSDWGRRKYEIIGATFYSKKGAECSAAALKLRTNHPVQNAQAGCVEACHGTGRAGKPLGKGCSKVVIHLWLDLPPSRDID